jgi:glutathione S-transferase
MPLTLYSHPLASFCHKVLIALYESGAPFVARLIDLGNAADRAELAALWPLVKFPLLRDEARGRAIPETSVIIEYLDMHYPGSAPLVPADPDSRVEAMIWDRFFDLYVSIPMQKIVADKFRPEDGHDGFGVAEAKANLVTAYDMIETQVAGKRWVAGDAFTIADCSAAPALFYSSTLVPFGPSHPETAAYFDRLAARPSFARVLEEAKPYFHLYPFRDAIPARFL